MEKIPNYVLQRRYAEAYINGEAELLAAIEAEAERRGLELPNLTEE